MPGGRPTDYTTEIAQQAWDYANGGWEKEDHAFPSVVGLSDVLTRSRSVLYAWAQDPEKEFKDILDTINAKQELVTFNKSMKGEYNATMAKLLLGKHGYHDRQDIDVTDKTPPTPEKRKFRIGELLNKCKGE